MNKDIIRKLQAINLGKSNLGDRSMSFFDHLFGALPTAIPASHFIDNMKKFEADTPKEVIAAGSKI
jgi:hypothetical protein